jgi:hypothetical protein
MKDWLIDTAGERIRKSAILRYRSHYAGHCIAALLNDPEMHVIAMTVEQLDNELLEDRGFTTYVVSPNNP